MCVCARVRAAYSLPGWIYYAEHACVAAAGRHVHARLQVLFSQDVAGAAATGPKRAGEHGRRRHRLGT